MLQEQWGQALDLAWSSYCAGTTPVGAIVIGPDDRIVATGRGHRYESSAQDGQLANCHIAHAEVNALAMLTSDRHYDDHVLITTLEPCCMCVGAAVQATVRHVRFAGRDPYGGASQMDIDTPQVRRRPLAVVGPDSGSAGFLAELLHITWLARTQRSAPLAAQERLGRVYSIGTDQDVVTGIHTLARRKAALPEVLAFAETLRR